MAFFNLWSSERLSFSLSMIAVVSAAEKRKASTVNVNDKNERRALLRDIVGGWTWKISPFREGGTSVEFRLAT